MAAELVGGALLSAFLQVAFDRLASSKVVEFFRAKKLDEKLLYKLNIVLLSIDALADDAEQKQFTDRHVKAWLFAARDAAFDAEDLLDEIDYELARCEAEAEAETESQTFTYEVSKFFNATSNSFNQKIDSGMKQVLDRLENLANQQGALGLKKGAYVGVGSGSKVSQKLPSTSLVVESVIYGRDDDKETIFNWLTSETDNRNQLSILSVVGMGGVGKTTLVQHVYNDPRMEEEEAHFDIKAWVCVSDDFNALMVAKTILGAITGSNDDSGNLEMVHRRLKEKLSGKRFLLVLDDVWNERREEWEAVQTPFSYGAPGSRILVTTRSEKVASNMRSKVHLLKQLQEDNCWQVFEKDAFQDDHPELNVELKEIGVKIVEKCKGLPLALKSIGSLLHTKPSISEWESVLLSKIWEVDSEIMPALLLSYHYLPSHLKRCFAYCALFPKDYRFDKEKLIELWMTENFLQVQQNKSPEEVGEEYFDYLLSRSFFQQQLSRYKTQCFVMHDLINDLAKYVCGDICFRYGVDEGNCIPKITRHFSFVTCEVEYFDGFKSLQDAKRLRTFKLQDYFPYVPWQSKLWIHEVFSKLKFIRVLSLACCSDLSEVPDSVGDLIHLRSLDLSSTRIRKLPDSICLLYNLQILKVNFCHNLEQLPQNLHKLTKLRCLEFASTKVGKKPMHLVELKNLQVLSTFCVEKSNKFNIQHLGGLNLHGRLSIEELQNVVNPLDALAVDLKSKIHLTNLSLKWNWNHIPDDPRKDMEVLENLQPSKNVRGLLIRNYGGTQFPSWLFSHALSNLTRLTLQDCKHCQCLPPLGLLPSLKSLTISGLDGIVSIGAEFYGSDSCSFTSLETLFFDNMKEWEEWECKDVFPRLQYLSIRGCPKLKGLSEQLLHVKELRIEYYGHSMEASSLEWIGHTVSNNSLESMIISGCDSLTTFPLDLFPNLRELELWRCRNLQMISQEHTHNHLKNLTIRYCPQFESFPSEGLSAPSLEKLIIWELKNLKLLPKCVHTLLPSLIQLSMVNCPQVEMFSDGGLPSNLERVSLSSFKLISLLKGALGANTCLKFLSIQKVDVESFPDEGSMPLSLTSLEISDCSNLKKLDYKGLRQLSSLKELSLASCGSLQCLPEEGLPKSISTLGIRGCPLLFERCQKREGEDWGKIAHIENLKII